MKGHALQNQMKQKDLHDIYYCIRYYPDGNAALVTAGKPLLRHDSALAGYSHIAATFESAEGLRPTCVRRFLEDSRVLGDRIPDQGQRDAFGQVDAWLKATGRRA